jgi:sugar phosphate isomerase/epimerase
VGITTNTIGGWEKDPLTGFREAHELGYRYVESFISYFPDYYPNKPAELKKRLDDIGVGVVSFSNGGAPTEMHFEDPAKREKIIADHLRLVRYSKVFGCDHLKINMGTRRPEGTSATDLEVMAKTLNELGKRVEEEEGIRFGVHAHMWSQFENRREIDYVLQHTDEKYVHFIPDTGHINLAGMDPVDLAKQLGHRVIEFHLKDTKPETRGGAKTRIDRPDMKTEPPFFPLGKGGVDFPGLKAHLDKISWRGWLTVELDSSPFIPPKESARISKEYLEKKLGITV